jgi:hypothetical protein
MCSKIRTARRCLKKTFADQVRQAQQANRDQLPVKVFAQDESRWGLMTIIRRLITRRGVKPIGPFPQPYKTLYLYGVVEPQTGDPFFFTFSHVDSTCFQVFLDLVAQHFDDTFTILLLDRGTFHRAQVLVIPQNRSLIFQPAATPAVHPMERVWQYLNDRIALKHFASLDELFPAVCPVLHDLTHEMLHSLTGFAYFLTAVNSVFF